MRILHVETGRNLYGGALQVLYLLQGLRDARGTENILVCPRGSGIAPVASDAARVREIPVKGDLDLGFLLRLIRILRGEKPDIIHLHSRRGADVLGGITARITGTKCVLTRRVDNPEAAPWVRIKYRLYDRIIAISDGISRVLSSEGVPPGKMTVVHSAVDAARFSGPADRDWFRKEFGLPANALACGTAAQFIPRKGHADLLAAIPGILIGAPAARFLFFGKGPLETALRQKTEALGIREKVLFAGFRDDMERILPCLDLLIHPAHMEGLGVSLLQAAAAGVPIVGTKVGGIPEAVADGANGILVEPGDPEALSRAAVRILSEEGLAKKMGLEGRRLAAERFSIDAMVRGNLGVYREMMKEEEGGREKGERKPGSQ
ncbi:MAG: glycosyltransferase [Proteobacteria bacterium]|nr:glycosyltransferase [Pseudomonadota bacterium]